MTKDFVYPTKAASTRRLVAILRVEKSWQTHELAAEWYSHRGLPLPSNCMVSRNAPVPLDKTDADTPNLRLWDRHYRHVAVNHGVVHACERIFCDVNDPPRLTNRQLVEWFGTIPNTRELPPIPAQHFENMLRWLVDQTSDAASRQRLAALLQPSRRALNGAL